MKIFVSTLGGDGGKSGISQYIIQMMRAFSSCAPDISFDVLAFRGEEEFYITDPERMGVITAPDSLRGSMRSLVWQHYAIPGICRRGDYDLAFFPAANRRLPFTTPCPSVGTYHDLAILHIPDKYDWVHRVYSLRVLPIMVRRLSAVITVSESSKRDLRDYVHVPEDRITVIPEGVDTERYFLRDPEDSGRRVEQKYALRRPFILYISRIEHPGKNHVRLIRAYNRLKSERGLPHQLVLAGSDWLGAEAVHQEAMQSPHSRDIRFTGFVPSGDIPHLYCAAEAFVFPSLFEGFGLPILEAMACGVPVACSDSSSLPEVAGDAAILFDACDEAAIAAAIDRILSGDDLRNQLVRKGLLQASAFTWEDSAKRTADLFRDVLKRQRKRY